MIESKTCPHDSGWDFSKKTGKRMKKSAKACFIKFYFILLQRFIKCNFIKTAF